MLGGVPPERQWCSVTRRIRLIVVVVVAVAASPSYADVWDEFIESAAAEHGDVGRRAAVFLAEHRPQRDSAIELALLEQITRDPAAGYCKNA